MPKRYPPEDPREWLNRARSNLAKVKGWAQRSVATVQDPLTTSPVETTSEDALQLEPVNPLSLF